MLKRCQFIKGMDIDYDDEQRVVIINRHALRFGSCHYTLMTLLLANQEVRDNALSLTLYQRKADADNQALIMKNISKLRCRLRAHGLDIRRIHDYGYRLVPLLEEMSVV